jgi:hypothetical protein
MTLRTPPSERGAPRGLPDAAEQVARVVEERDVDSEGFSARRDLIEIEASGRVGGRAARGRGAVVV